MNKRIWIGIVSVLIVLIVLVRCVPQKTPDTTVSDGTDTAQTNTGTASDKAETDPSDQAGAPTVDCVTVTTDWGNVYFQEQWNGLMLTEQTQEGDVLTVAFYTQINDVRYDLFQMMIGGGDGTQVGQLTGADGVKRDVYMRMAELADLEGLTDSEQNRLYAMREDVNFVIENLR